MTTFVFTYSVGAGMPETPEAQEEVMAAWGAWYGELGAAVVDPGAPFGAARTVQPDGSVTDTATRSGYTIVEAVDLDAAVAMAKGCPVLQGDSSVEVSECLDMG